MMIRSRLGRSAAMLVALTFVAASCGDDEDEAGSTTTAAAEESTTAAAAEESTTTAAAEESTTTTVAPPTGEPIRLMTIFEAGGAGATPEISDGVQAAAEAINRNGGINNRPIEIIECDAGNDPNTAAECGRQAVAEGVVAVVGALTSNAGEYMPILEENKIPAIGNVPAATADFLSAASFPIYGGLPAASAALAAGLVEKGATNISVARVDLAAASAIAVFANTALATKGLAVGKDVSVPASAPDMATYVALATDGGTDGVVVGLFGQDATNFIIQLRQTAPDVQIAATTTDFAAVVEALGDGADGIVVTQFFESVEGDSPAAKQFMDDLVAIGVDEPGGFRANSYASVMVFAQIVSEMADISAAALWDLLPTLENIDVGMMPPVQFKTGGAGGIPRLFNVCVQYAEMQDGKSTVFSDGFLNPFTGEAC
jgi:ABC-type branched-subunit amino acid transport system substrate-binding protein